MSHTFDNLLQSDQIAEHAKTCAMAVPLLHATTADAETIVEIFRVGKLAVSHARRRSRTLDAEYRADMSDAIYFFAGRVCPRKLGTVVFLSANASQPTPHGKATPFDTGGVLHGKSFLPCGTDDKARRTYVREHEVPSSQFRKYLGYFLDAFFASPSEYWDSYPNRAIDGHRFHSKKYWRDWTFEVRSEIDVEIDKMYTYIDKATSDMLAEQLLVDPTFSIAYDRLRVVNLPPKAAEYHARQLGVESLLE